MYLNCSKCIQADRISVTWIFGLALIQIDALVFMRSEAEHATAFEASEGI